ncbi:MAG: M48 family metalloprotease [Desulfohalobiaceae bacterium]|nr:M48 family metalloprotease [Desulfohalobiaceae bacterium]
MNTLESMSMQRRDFLRLACLTTIGGTLSGCAANPVTGKSQLMLMSRVQEIQIDRERSPHQFSADLGTVQDQNLSRYLQSTGSRLAALSHRPDMPYSFRGVNAVYVNAYAFPGGSIALTRGILLEMDSEAQLAALLGHELAHVNARHTASHMSKGVLVSTLLAGAGLALQGRAGEYTRLLTGLGNMAAGALLASYSRDNERQADDLGMQYLVRAGYSPEGMVKLQDMLRSLSREQPSAIELMFATHPMSEERYASARKTASSTYREHLANPVYRERYLDETASIRRLKPLIKGLQNGRTLMSQKNLPQAEAAFRKALKHQPRDYAGLIMLAGCLMRQEKYDPAERLAQKAKTVYPQEAQSRHVLGVCRLARKRYASALTAFQGYEQLLPGNPSIVFLQGLCFEGMQQFRQAAVQYSNFLQQVQQGEQAKYAYSRLKEWGYLK